jgi:hypothetical protein
MAHGTPKSKLHDTFKERISDLEKRAKQQSDFFRSHSGTRPWHTPTNMADVDTLDVPNLHEPAWNRDAINQQYCTDVVSNAKDAKSRGTTGDVKSLKTQLDFMAVEERAWRLRHASAIRCSALAHGRIKAHGATNESIFSIVRNAADGYRLASAENANIPPDRGATP